MGKPIMVQDIIRDFQENKSNERLEIGTGALIKQGENFVFALSKEKYWEEKEDITHLSFQNIGGAIEEGETPIQALEREAREEIGTEIKVKISKQTLVSYEDINYSESKTSPLMIYTDENPGKPGDPEAEGTWKLLGFLYKAQILEEPQPSSEIPAIIKIPEKLFLNSENGLTRKQIEEKGEIITQRPLPEKFKAKPKFSAKKILENKEKIFAD